MNTPRMMARAPVITQEIDGRSHSEKHNEGDHVFRDAHSVIESDSTLQSSSKIQKCCRQSLSSYSFPGANTDTLPR